MGSDCVSVLGGCGVIVCVCPPRVLANYVPCAPAFPFYFAERALCRSRIEYKYNGVNADDFNDFITKALNSALILFILE